MLKLLVVCPCFNEVDYVSEFVDCLKKQSVFCRRDIEVHICFVDGNSNDGTYEKLSLVASNDEAFEVISNDMRYVPHGLNLAIRAHENKQFEFMVRMDFHSEYPSTYIEGLVDSLVEIRINDTRVVNVGYCVETIPANNTSEANVISKLLSSKFGVGGSSFRVSNTLKRPISVDTVPFGCFHFSVFEKVGLFDEELLRNQDDEFNLRLKNNGYLIFLLPNQKVKYVARPSSYKLYKMMYQYGLFKPLVNYKCKTVGSYRQLAPLCFVLGLILCLFLLYISPIPFLLLFSSYTIFVALFCREVVKNSALKKNLSVYLLSYRCLFLTHFGYGLGYLKGLVQLATNNKSRSISHSR